MGQLIKTSILPTHRISDIVRLHGEDVARKQIRTALLVAEQMIGDILGAKEVVEVIRDEHWDLTTEDLELVARKLLKMDIYGKPTASHVMKAIMAVQEEKSYEWEQKHNTVKAEGVLPFTDEKLLGIMKSIGKPKELNLPWGALNADNLMNLEEVSGLSEQEKKNRKWAREWFTERAAWAKETGNKIEDYPVTMESFVEARWVELAKLAE